MMRSQLMTILLKLNTREMYILIKVESFQRTATHFNTNKNATEYIAAERKNVISQGMTKRLVAYTKDRVKMAGFECILDGATFEVETSEADYVSSERVYHVTVITKDNGVMVLNGIMLSKYGWPGLDHRLSIEQ